MKRFFRYLFRGVLAILLLLVLLIALLYIPAVQDYIRRQAVGYLSAKGWSARVGELKVSFPLDVDLRDVYLGRTEQDTLVSLKSLHLDLGFRHILKKELSLDHVALDQTKFIFSDDSTGMKLRVDAGKVLLAGGRANLVDKYVRFSDVQLAEASVFLKAPSVSRIDTVPSKPFPWKFGVERISMNRVDYRMESATLPLLYAGIVEGLVAGGLVDLGRQTVDADSVEIAGGWCDIRTAEVSSSQGDSGGKKDSLARESSTLWRVKTGTVHLDNSAFSLTSEGEKKMEIVLSGIGVVLDSVYNRGIAVKASLRDLRLVQREGVRVTAMRADIDLDTSAASVGNMYIHTLYSQLSMNVRSNSSVTNLFKEQPLRVEMKGVLGLHDIQPFWPEIPKDLVDWKCSLDVLMAASSRRISVEHFQADVPGKFNLAAQGEVSSYTDLNHLSGEFSVKGQLADAAFLAGMLKQDMLSFPRNISIDGSLKAHDGDLASRLMLRQGEGKLTLDAKYNVLQQNYGINLDLSAFPLNRFLKVDSLGAMTASLRLSGEKFVWEKARSELMLSVSSFGFKGHDYRDINLGAALKNTSLEGRLTSGDPDMKTELLFNADSVGREYLVQLNGWVTQVSPVGLKLAAYPKSVSLNVDVRATAGREENYTLRAIFDSIRMGDELNRHDLGTLTLDMASSRTQTSLEMGSGDMKLQFRADTSLKALPGMFAVGAEIISGQIRERKVNALAVQHSLPSFSLHVESGQGNALVKYLASRNIGFRNLDVTLSSRPSGGLRFGGLLTDPRMGEKMLSSASVGFWQTQAGFAYAVDVTGEEQNNGKFQIMASGNIRNNQLRMELRQKDRSGQIGFDLGVDVAVDDSTFAASLFPITPILGYRRWIVNSDNRVIFRKNWKTEANIRLTSQNKIISLESQGDGNGLKDRLQVIFSGIDLDGLVTLFPFAPPLAGQLNTDLLLYTTRDSMLGMDGNINIRDFAYNGKRVGSVDLGLHYGLSGSFRDHSVNVELRLDSVKRAMARGNFSVGEDNRKLDAELDIPGFPLQVANAFLPDGSLGLGGILHGNLKFGGTFDSPLVNGNLAFRGGTAEIGILGTTFGMDTNSLVVKENRLQFNRYQLIAPNKSTLVLNGSVDIWPIDHIAADLSVSGKNFEVINVKPNNRSLVYGKAYADIAARMTGKLPDLSVTGNISLLNRSSVTYTLRSSSAELQDKSMDLVRFVSFRDSSQNEKDMLTSRIQASSLLLKMFLEIGDDVSMNVNLSEDGQNRIALQGGGNLILSMNPESGLALVGKYVLTNGVVVYNVPLVGKKEFNIRNGSYVEWTGNVADPRMNITAGEFVNATVEEGDRNRLVMFESLIRIQNTLSQPEISFDLSAPNDMVIQNQLATFSPEERTKQAMNLLIYGTYTGPGAASSGNSNVAGNAISSFVENELNKYTRKAGFTFGLDTYNTTSDNTRRDFTYQFSRQFFNDKVRVKVGGRISTDSNEGGDNNMEENLVDDISIEYVLTKKRNLYLKVFRHSNYESVLEGEVTQTGVGVVWRRSFRKVKDLFVRKQNRTQPADSSRIDNKDSGQ